jgi:hypothetical protein
MVNRPAASVGVLNGVPARGNRGTRERDVPCLVNNGAGKCGEIGGVQHCAAAQGLHHLSPGLLNADQAELSAFIEQLHPSHEGRADLPVPCDPAAAGQ